MSPRENLNKAIPGIISGLVVTIIGSFIVFNLNAGKMDEVEFKKQLDSKASKEELRDGLENEEKQREKDINALKELYLTDVVWIKQTLNRLIDEKYNDNYIKNNNQIKK